MRIERESDLRKWLKEHWPGTIEWSEPGRGATVGKADADLCHNKLRVPTECKTWWFKKKGLCCLVRPAQIRYHMMSAREGRRTALLATWENGMQMNVWVIAGHWCPFDKFDKAVYKHAVFVCDINDPEGGKKLLRVLSSESLWYGGKDAAILRLSSLGAEKRI